MLFTISDTYEFGEVLAVRIAWLYENTDLLSLID